jgi:hypothetical protein
MNFCWGRSLLAVSAALVSIPAIGSTPRVLHIAMLEIGSHELNVEYSTLNVRHVEDEGPNRGEYRLAPIIHGPSYFSAPLRYDHQTLRGRHPLQGSGFGIHWDSGLR